MVGGSRFIVDTADVLIYILSMDYRLPVDFLKQHIGCWDFLTENEKTIVAEKAYLLQANDGEIVITTSSPCLGIMFVTAGRLRTYLTSDDGKEVDLFYVEADEVSVLTASCILNAITFEVTVKAEGHVEAIVIPATTFSRIKQDNVRVENYVLQAISEHFSDVVWTMQQMLFLPMEQRIAIYLHDEYVRVGSLDVQVTHKQIAQALGTAREVITRILKIMQEKRMINVSRGSITILDKKQLLREAQR